MYGFLFLTVFPPTSFVNKEDILGGLCGAGPIGSGAINASSSSRVLIPIGLNEVRTKGFFLEIELSLSSLFVTA